MFVFPFNFCFWKCWKHFGGLNVGSGIWTAALDTKTARPLRRARGTGSARARGSQRRRGATTPPRKGKTRSQRRRRGATRTTRTAPPSIAHTLLAQPTQSPPPSRLPSLLQHPLPGLEKEDLRPERELRHAARLALEQNLHRAVPPGVQLQGWRSTPSEGWPGPWSTPRLGPGPPCHRTATRQTSGSRCTPR